MKQSPVTSSKRLDAILAAKSKQQAALPTLQLPAAQYRVPQRFGMAPVLITMTMLAFTYVFFQALDLPPWFHLTVSLFFFAVCGAQMWIKQEPRLVSTIVGAAFLPTWVVISIAVFPKVQEEMPSVAWMLLCLPFLAVLGAGLGYLLGALGAGVFLVIDQLIIAGKTKAGRRRQIESEEFLMEGPTYDKWQDKQKEGDSQAPAESEPALDAIIEPLRAAHLQPSSADNHQIAPTVRPLSQPQAIPVYNCQLLVSQENNGAFRARSIMLAGVDALGSSERIALQAAVAAFKQIVGDCHARGISVPWLDPPREKLEVEQERWIAVHL